MADRYRDEPAIGMWELINEPGAPNSSLRAFFGGGGEIHSATRITLSSQVLTRRGRTGAPQDGDSFRRDPAST